MKPNMKPNISLTLRLLTAILALVSLLIFTPPYLLGVQSQNQKEGEAIFTFGKIEVLKHDTGVWEFLKKGDALQPKDIVRIPPASILRIKTKDDINLPMIIGSREQEVSGLIAYAKESLSFQTHKKLISETSGTVDIDSLPVGRYASSALSESPNQGADFSEVKLEVKQLKRLRLLVQSKAEVVKDPALKQVKDIPTVFNSYPGPNLLKATRIFQIIGNPSLNLLNLNETEKSAFEFQIQSGYSSDIDRSLIFCSLLKAISIESDIQINDEGKLFLIFDSGIPNSEFKTLTANRKLTYRHSNQNIWIPLHLNLKRGESNFIQAWYDGSEIASK